MAPLPPPERRREMERRGRGRSCLAPAVGEREEPLREREWEGRRDGETVREGRGDQALFSGGCGVRERVECFRVCVCFYMLEVVVGWCGLVWVGLVEFPPP